MNTPDESKYTFCDIYVDESSHTKHRYLVMGCLIIERNSVDQFRQSLVDARLPELPHGEMKWTKVSMAKVMAYRRFVDTFFQNASHAARPHFHAVAVDTHKIKDKIYNGGSREIGFNKEVYQLLLKQHRLYKTDLFHVYPDHRTTPHTTEELRLVLNRGAHTKDTARQWPFRRLHWRDSSREPCIQLVDLLIGGIAYHLNGHHALPDASPAKCALSNHIIRKSPINDVYKDTSINGWFTLWHRQLK